MINLHRIFKNLKAPEVFANDGVLASKIYGHFKNVIYFRRLHKKYLRYSMTNIDIKINKTHKNVLKEMK